ncbi:putative hem oxygenase-like, multi-helical [Helianthus debilis subsp. tardiflorus]
MASICYQMRIEWCHFVSSLQIRQLGYSTFFLLQLNSLLTFQPLLLSFHAIIKRCCSINRSLVTTSDLARQSSLLVNSIPNLGLLDLGFLAIVQQLKYDYGAILRSFIPILKLLIYVLIFVFEVMVADFLTSNVATSDWNFRAAMLLTEDVLDKLSVPLTGEELDTMQKLYHQALKLEIEFFLSLLLINRRFFHYQSSIFLLNTVLRYFLILTYMHCGGFFCHFG